MPRQSILIEACVSSAADAAAAVEAGAHRIELCAALEVGGLTPSIGLIQRVSAAVSVPVMVMIRPRVGDFTPSDDEFVTMLADIAAAKRAGAAGVVFGLLTPNGEVDAPRTKLIVDAAEGLQTVFNRAIDFTPNPVAAATKLADLSVTRVLTSGGATTALEGAATIRQMAKQTADHLEILPGGGVRAANIASILEATGCRQLHLGPGIAEQGPILLNGPALTDTTTLSSGAHRKLDAAAFDKAIRTASSLAPDSNPKPTR
ncbi:copper homeostasis protein CutC [Botrimarina mediterranea]|uniref:copper homeostasis protein CutC n=1 Tax=Botrimarina mediterranea TaxID=2528022 RepID=UPI00118B8A80|nr:Copper homeostasis protein CutC [Planctomycetes bacterium K2D]